MLHEAWEGEKAALRRGIKKSRFQEERPRAWIIPIESSTLCGNCFHTQSRSKDRTEISALFGAKYSSLSKAQGKYTAGYRRGAKRDLQKGDRGMRGDSPTSLQVEVLRRLEEAEVDPAEQGQQTSRGCLVVQTNMSIGWEKEACGFRLSWSGKTVSRKNSSDSGKAGPVWTLSKLWLRSPQMQVYPSDVLFFKFLSLVFLQKKIFQHFYFIANFVIQSNFISLHLQFFHIFFYYNVYPSHGQFFKFLPLYFLQK